MNNPMKTPKKQETKIARWKLPLIRWALRQLRPTLPLLYTKDFGYLKKFGIVDFHRNKFKKDLAIYLD